ncbi:DeoR/GlpR family DNA-binding transcription regulator [Chitinimonas lacunae]|uniref:DeoR/GlpR family DNA-binding transcription regulator n=1 Tax=Chitinimonas lacunae TaxID=1963018 RepID=A0ABV8MV92_9NEIS
MFAEERRQHILAALTRDGRVEVAALAERFAVSEDTVRRDLNTLAEQGFLQKTHGGAVALATARMDWQSRRSVLTEAKARIGTAAAELVEPHQTLFVDAGLTTLEFVRALQVRPLRIVTNSLDVAQVLADDGEVQLVLSGGEWFGRERHLSGPAALATVRAHRADLAILGACAVHPTLGVTATHPGDAEVKRAMFDGAARRVLLADRGKFDQVAPNFVARLDAFDLLITDAPPPDLGPAAPSVKLAE